MGCQSNAPNFKVKRTILEFARISKRTIHENSRRGESITERTSSVTEQTVNDLPPGAHVHVSMMHSQPLLQCLRTKFPLFFFSFFCKFFCAFFGAPSSSASTRTRRTRFAQMSSPRYLKRLGGVYRDPPVIYLDDKP